jgi:Ca2+-binding RTX toxin-like protein
MLIEVKTTQQQDVEPKGAKRFEFSMAERLTRLPAYFALMIVGIAAYIRSITAAQASTPEIAGRTGEKDGNAGEPRDDQVAQIDDLVASGIDETETGGIEDAGGRRGLGIEPGNSWPASFVVPDFPQFHFVEPSFQASDPRSFSPAALMGSPVNDNFGGNSGGSNGGISSPLVPVGTELASSDNDNADLPGDPGNDDDEGSTNTPGGQANRAPVVMGPVRLNDVFAGQVILIALVHLLRGASDPDGDALSVEDVVISGAELVATAEGWLLQTEPGMVGPVLITYRVTDGEAWVGQEAILDIVRKVLALGDDDDLIVGSPFDDDIFGSGGNDIIDAMGGNDHVDGGAGDDHINGGDGDDVLVGGLGNDVIFGGNGNDLVYGGDGDDRLFGEAGDDTVFGEAGDDHIEGGDGKDHLDGGEGDDAIYGGDGIDRLIGAAGHDLLDGGKDNDLLEAGAGDDTLKGGEGDDVLIDGEGDDEVYGQAGDDTLVASAGDDVMDGGDGHDTVDYSEAEEDMVIDAVGGTSYSEELGIDSVDNVEELIGGAGDDMLIVGGKAMVLSGGKGKDTFVFEVTDLNPGLSDNVVHKILDFVVGDRVRVRDYDLDRQAQAAERDMFEAIYGDGKDEWLQSDVPLQVSHELIDDENWTIIVADLNGDNIYDLAVNIQGVMLTPPENLA